MRNSLRSTFEELLDEMPQKDADYFKVLSWGQRFNAYDRWASSPNLLHDLLLPLRQSYELKGQVPDGTGCDAVRALMFFKCREHHFTDCPPQEVIDLFVSLRTYVESVLNSAD